MKAIRRFTVRVTLPEPLAALHGLMLNLRWSWHRPTADLFASIDPAAWKDALEDLEQHWFAPLARLLRKGRIRRLVIATVANGRSYRWSVSRMNLWRLWRPADEPGISLRRP